MTPFAVELPYLIKQKIPVTGLLSKSIKGRH
jgi:hypothetical protein